MSRSRKIYLLLNVGTFKLCCFQMLLNRRSLVRSPARPIFFPRMDDSHCDMIHSSLTAILCFGNGYVGKQPVALREYSAKCWLKELQESMDRCTGCRDIAEILLKTALNTIQSINLMLLYEEEKMSNKNKNVFLRMVGPVWTCRSQCLYFKLPSKMPPNKVFLKYKLTSSVSQIKRIHLYRAISPFGMHV